MIATAYPATTEVPAGVTAALHGALERGATVLSVCSGVFLVAAADLLENRRITCHWYDADALARRFPSLRVEPDRLYVHDGPIITSAGTAAGIDACLHVVRRELGARVANAIAHRMVVPPHRDGGQAQYIRTPVPRRAGFGTADLLRHHFSSQAGTTPQAYRRTFSLHSNSH